MSLYEKGSALLGGRGHRDPLDTKGLHLHFLGHLVLMGRPGHLV